LTVALLVVAGGFLFISAAAKAVTPRPAMAALVGFGLPPGPARIAVGAMTAVEATIGASIVLFPASGVTHVLCLTLFGVFAVVGLLAILSRRHIQCGCMGALHGSKLGWHQLGQFGVVAVMIGFVRLYPPRWDAEPAASVLFALLVGTAGVLLAFAAAPWWRVQRARTSLASVAAYVEALRWPESSAVARGPEQ
jgi:hypothetical protein